MTRKKFAYSSELGVLQVRTTPEVVWATEPDPPNHIRPLCIGSSLKDDFLICAPKNMSKRDILTYCAGNRLADIKAKAVLRDERCEYGNHWLVIR